MPEFDRTKWDAKYADPDFAPREPSAVLMALEKFLPKRGRAIDVAGGAGRNAIWLAQRGLDVTIVDVSSVGLAQAAARAKEAGVTLTTLCTDLEEQPFPAGAWDLIVSCRYLQRPLFAVYPPVLARGGTLVVIQPTKSNLERHEKPPADFLLEDDELPRLVQGLTIVHSEEGWLADGRHDAAVVARK
ncbi:MAG TPA: class I SAM-dependent methyltransferase [Pirellulaceae bacterium]|nr:class I SAM-dependent methyltransferase [Pirellulaceae bacterium]